MTEGEGRGVIGRTRIEFARKMRSETTAEEGEDMNAFSQKN